MRGHAWSVGHTDYRDLKGELWATVYHWDCARCDTREVFATCANEPLKAAA